jgi:hypothetical protein
MKYLFLIILVSNFTYSQSINGIYKSNFSSFINSLDNSKNYTNYNESMIVVDIYEVPSPSGSVTISFKNEKGENASIKFVVKTNKKYHYEDGNTYLYYDGVISLMGYETKTECTIAFDVEVETLIIVYESGNSQTWNLTKI